MKKSLNIFFILVLGTLFNSVNSQAINITVSQVDTFAIKGLPEQPVLKLNINTGTSLAFTLEKIVIKSLSTNNSDISKVKIYKTTYNRFSKADYPGEATSLFEGGKSLSGDTAVFEGLTFPLQAGNNYFWVVFDLNANSIVGDILDASIRIGGITITGSTYPAALQSPTGASVIRQKYFFDSFEKFEAGTFKPMEWTVTTPPGDENASWKSAKGGVSGNPTDPKSGRYNARSDAENTLGRVSRLISKPLNLSLATKPKLTFYHAQSYRENEDKSDSLGLYYGFTSNGPCHFLKNYTQPTPDYTWVKREIDLPDAMRQNNVYLIFKSTAQYGWGVCVDSVTIYESIVSTRTVKAVRCSHPSTSFVPQGTLKNPILRIDIGVQGNQDYLYFSSITINSLNSSDADLATNGVKLYSTPDSVFSSPTLLGTGSFSNGKVTFNGFNLRLESGENYYWVTYDATAGATPDNILDAKINTGDIIISDGNTYPSLELSPEGNRKIKQVIFFDDFETTDKGWILEGEFEINKPLGKGGNAYSFADPIAAYSQDKVLGNDLSSDGNYGRNQRHLATSPLISAQYFKNTYLNYARWLNAENQDSAVVEYQFEGESKWHEFWSSSSTITEGAWSSNFLSVKNLFDRKKFRIRFRLGTTTNLEDYSGWNIDYFFISGDSIKYDAEITGYVGPLSKCGLTSGEKIQVNLKNTGAKILHNIPLKLSIDGGKNWIEETLPGDLAVNEEKNFEFSAVDLSKTKIYNIIAKVTYPGDNYNDNDSVVYDLTSVPTYTLPYYDGFEKDTTFWLTGGINSSWMKGSPTNYYFDDIYEEYKCWKTGSEFANLNEDSYVTTPCFNLSNIDKPLVDLHYKYWSTIQKAGTRMEYSLDGGSTWTYIPSHTYSFDWNWYNDSVTFFQDKTIGWIDKSLNDESNFAWLNGKQTLPGETSNKSLVRFRFHFKADTSLKTVDRGFAFDAFNILNAPDNASVVSIDDFNSPACQYANSDKLKISVKNVGIRKINQNDSIFIGIKVNNYPVVIDTFKLNSDLELGETRQFIMKKSSNISDPGTYNIKAFIVEKFPNYYGDTYDLDELTKEIKVFPNPLTNLPDTIYTAFPDILKVNALFDENYDYSWEYNGSVVSTISEVEVIATGFGNHYLTVQNRVSGCTTEDTVYIKELIPDIGIETIISPVTNCGYKTPTHPVVRIKNYGTYTLPVNQIIPIKIKLNKEDVISDEITLSENFVPNASLDFTLLKTLDLMKVKTDTLKIWTDLTIDKINDNDTSLNNFEIHGYPKIFLGNDTMIRDRLSYDIDAGPGFTSWSWSDGITTTQKLTITKPGDYSVTVTDNNNCANSDTIHVHLAIHDLSMHKLVSPVNSCMQPASTDIKCRIKNTGTDTIQVDEPIILYYQVNNGSMFQDTIKLTNILIPNDSLEHTFKNKMAMADKGSYAFKLKSILANDIQPLNDSILKTVEVFGLPQFDLGENGVIKAMSYSVYPGKFVSYKWQDNSTDTAWTITKTKYQPNNKYKVTVTDINGCSATDTVVIFLLINDLAVTEAILPTSICALSNKETINLKITNTGNTPLVQSVDVYYSLNGAPEGSKESFNFNGTMGTSMIHTFSTPIDMSAKGNYSFKFRIVMAEDINRRNDTATFATKVLGYPTIDFKATNDTFIVKLPFTLHPGPGYAEYLWQDNSADSIYNITSSNYNPANTVYNVIVTNENGCSVTESVDVIEAKPDLAITQMSLPLDNCNSLAEKLAVTLKNNGNVLISNQEVSLAYTLNGGTPIVKQASVNLPKGTSQIIEFADNVNLSTVGSHNLNVDLSYVDDINATDNSKVYELKIFANPVINFGLPSDTVRTSTFPYTIDAGAGYQSYKWNNNTTERYLSVNDGGNYIVRVIDNNNCSAKDSVYILNTTSTGSLKDKSIIKLYPNPASNYLYVSINLDEKQDLMMDIISPSGKVVYSTKFENMDEYRDDVDVSGLPKGLYYVRIYTEDSMVVQKIVVK